MGDVGTRRSTLVSKLPIFRRSITRRQESLPSSPSSNNTAGLHSSSPSSTNSSSGSTGKRRSIFRTPSLGFHHKKENDQRYDSSQAANISQNRAQNLDLEEQPKHKASPSCIQSSCRKKITRSLTEDFEKRKDHSLNRNVFTNCLGKSEDDDSGFVEEQTKSSVKHSSRRLLPRSFSSHYRFSKHGSQCRSTPSPAQSPACGEEVPLSPETDSLLIKPVLQSAPEVKASTESSLPSPLLSTDHTTAPQTPSDLIFMDDSASEADSLPVSVSQKDEKHYICKPLSTSQPSKSPVHVVTQINRSIEPEEDTSQCDGLMLSKHSDPLENKSQSNQHPASCQESIAMVELSTQHSSNLEDGTREQQPLNTTVFLNGGHIGSRENLPKKTESAVSEARPHSHVYPSMPEARTTMHFYDTLPSHIHNGRARVNYASSFSPYRDGRHSERRLRSSSEGTAGGSRMAYKPREQNSEELTHFRKPRTISTSSKMNSMDVLNNLGSCELDEDDLMLDLEFTEEQHPRRVCREDSYQSIVSCSAVALSQAEQLSDTTKPTEEASTIPETATRNLHLHLPRENEQEDGKCPRLCQMPTSPSVEWPFAQEDISSLESLSFRLMMQDCVSVKTLLLKMKRILQESNEMSPASSTTSLPISPIAERGHPFSDIMKDECSMLKLQLKERDEHVRQLQEELKAARISQSLNTSKQDKWTQTECINHEVTNNVQKNSSGTEGSIYKAIRPVHCFQHYQLNPTSGHKTLYTNVFN